MADTVARQMSMHSKFGPPAKFVFTRASKVSEDEDKDEDAEYDESAVGDRYAIKLTRETICMGDYLQGPFVAGRTRRTVPCTGDYSHPCKEDHLHGGLFARRSIRRAESHLHVHEGPRRNFFQLPASLPATSSEINEME